MTPKKILCVDLGGTHCRYQLVRTQPELKTYPYVKSKNDDFSSFYESLKAFLSQNYTENTHDLHLVVGLAGVVENNKGSITNRGWELCGEKLVNEFSLSSAVLLNDLEAAAWGVCGNKPDVTLYDARENNAELNYERVGITVGVGTGLGLAYFHNPKNRSPRVFSTETGQSAFSPRTNLQRALHDKLLKTHGHASIEYILSGSGLKFIYDHMSISNQFTSADILERAKSGTDDTAVTAVENFACILGQVLGNLTLIFRPEAGIHLIGGMVERTLPWLQQDAFLQSYFDQARMPHIPRDISIFLHTDDELALKGCLHASQFGLLDNKTEDKIGLSV